MQAEILHLTLVQVRRRKKDGSTFSVVVPLVRTLRIRRHLRRFRIMRRHCLVTYFLNYQAQQQNEFDRVSIQKGVIITNRPKAIDHLHSYNVSLTDIIAVLKQASNLPLLDLHLFSSFSSIGCPTTFISK